MGGSCSQAIASLRGVRESCGRASRERNFAVVPHQSPTSILPHTYKSSRSWARRRQASHRNPPESPLRRGSACRIFLPRNLVFAERFARPPLFQVPPAPLG